MIPHINISSSNIVYISTKDRNATTSFTHTMMHIMQDISPIGVPSPQQLTSSMVLSYTDIPRNNPRHPGTRTCNPGVTWKLNNTLKRIWNLVHRKPDNTLKGIHNLLPHLTRNQRPRELVVQN